MSSGESETPRRSLDLVTANAIIEVGRIIGELDALHQPSVFTSAPYSTDGENDDLCCSTCVGAGSYRTSWAEPQWPCRTRELLDELKELL